MANYTLFQSKQLNLWLQFCANLNPGLHTWNFPVYENSIMIPEISRYPQLVWSQSMSLATSSRPWCFLVSGLTWKGYRFHTIQNSSPRSISRRKVPPIRSPPIGSGNTGVLSSVSFRISTSTRNHRTGVVTQIQRRYYSVLSRPPQNCLEIRILSRRNILPRRLARSFHISSALCYDRLQSLEDAANRDRDNANVQARFLQVRYYDKG
jgi:hypothetical protein